MKVAFPLVNPPDQSLPFLKESVGNEIFSNVETVCEFAVAQKIISAIVKMLV